MFYFISFELSALNSTKESRRNPIVFINFLHSSLVLYVEMCPLSRKVSVQTSFHSDEGHENILAFQFDISKSGLS